jgi:hypothetical protein
MGGEDEKADAIVEGRQQGRHITARKDPSTLHGFCCGTGIGRVTTEDKGVRAHYTFCPVWEAFAQMRDRHRGDGRVFEFPERPKLLGRDPEVEADLLGVDVEQIIEIRKRKSAGISPKLLSGESAAEDIVEGWKREEEEQRAAEMAVA